MMTPRVEFVPTSRPAGSNIAPRLFYTFRSRSNDGDYDISERIDKRRRELRRVDEGSAEAAEILREIGMLLARSGRLRESLETYRRGLHSSRRAEDHRQAARALEAMGMLHARRGELEAALECYFDALREIASGEDPRGEAAAWIEIASVYSETGMHDLALEALDRSIGLLSAPSDSYLQARARLSAANVLVALSRPAEAIDQAMRALVALEAFDDYAGQVEALLVIGSIYRHLGERSVAVGYVERAAELARDRAHVPGLVSAMTGLAEIRRDEMRYELAYALAEEGIVIAHDGGMLEHEWRLHELASQVCELRGDVAAALAHCRQFAALRESSRARVRDERFDELRVRHAAAELARERDALRTEADELRGALALKNRELTAAALTIVQKSELLNEVRTQLGGLMQASAGYSSAIVQPILADIADSRDSDDSWQMFELQFDRVHSEFMRRLAERFPSLTPMELKICTLTRIDLSAKDIGRLLHVSERNIQNHRYRLRKKLLLVPEDNLATFLAGI